MAAYLLILCTIDNPEKAKGLARLLVDSRAAACVAVSAPLTVYYRWQGKVEEAQEWQLQIKTVQSNYSLVERLLSENHPYQVPEIVAIPIASGSEKYLHWLAESTR